MPVRDYIFEPERNTPVKRPENIKPEIAQTSALGPVLSMPLASRVVWLIAVTLATFTCSSLVVSAQTPDVAPIATDQSKAVPNVAIDNPLPALSTSVWSKAGTRVDAIQFEGVTFGASDTIVSQLKQKSGQPLNPQFVRDDLRRLFASGRYRNIAVYGQPGKDGSGITLVFSGAAQYYVGRVTIIGVKDDRLASLLEVATKMDPGTVYTDGAIPAAIQGVKESLQQNGFYESAVAVKTTVDDVGHQVNATFTIASGGQARVGDVAVEGKDPRNLRSGISQAGQPQLFTFRSAVQQEVSTESQPEYDEQCVIRSSVFLPKT